MTPSVLHYDMKKYVEIGIVALALLLWLACAVFAAAVACEPVGNVVFSIAAGSVYRKVGEAAFDAKGYPRSLPVSIREKEVSINTAASLKTVRKIKFDYSYQRQAIKNEGALPQGLYRIGCEESGSVAKGNLIKHIFGFDSWGSYHWRLVPSQYTDTRGRDRYTFTVHGGAEPGSAGCIDLASGDTDLKKYLDTLDMTSICIYARYPDSEIVVENTKFIYPDFKSPIFIE